MNAAAISITIGAGPGGVPVPDAPSIELPNDHPVGPRELPTVDVFGQGIQDILDGLLGIAPRLGDDADPVGPGPLPLPQPGNLMIRSGTFLA